MHTHTPNIMIFIFMHMANSKTILTILLTISNKSAHTSLIILECKILQIKDAYQFIHIMSQLTDLICCDTVTVIYTITVPDESEGKSFIQVK